MCERCRPGFDIRRIDARSPGVSSRGCPIVQVAVQGRPAHPEALGYVLAGMSISLHPLRGGDVVSGVHLAGRGRRRPNERRRRVSAPSSDFPRRFAGVCCSFASGGVTRAVRSVEMPSNAGLQRAQRRVVGIIQWSPYRRSPSSLIVIFLN